MHIFILVLFALSFVPIPIAIVFVANYFRNRAKGISILDLYWVSGAGSILLSAVGSYLVWIFNGDIPGLDYTSAKAAGISVIVCAIYLVFLRFLLSIFKFIKTFINNVGF